MPGNSGNSRQEGRTRAAGGQLSQGRQQRQASQGGGGRGGSGQGGGNQGRSGQGGQRRTQLARQRTLLSSERTFLAWLRTGLELTILGLIILEFSGGTSSYGSTFSRSVSAGIISAGVVVSAMGIRRYFVDTRREEQQEIQPSYRSVLLAGGLVVAVGLISIALAFLIHR